MDGTEAVKRVMEAAGQGMTAAQTAKILVEVSSETRTEVGKSEASILGAVRNRTRN